MLCWESARDNPPHGPWGEHPWGAGRGGGSGSRSPRAGSVPSTSSCRGVWGLESWGAVTPRSGSSDPSSLNGDALEQDGDLPGISIELTLRCGPPNQDLCTHLGWPEGGQSGRLTPSWPPQADSRGESCCPSSQRACGASPLGAGGRRWLLEPSLLGLYGSMK